MRGLDQTAAVGRRKAARIRDLAPWVLLSAFLTLVGVARGLYAAHHVLPSARFEVLIRLGWLALVWHWFTMQMQPYRSRWPIDMGLFIAPLWFVCMPYYLWRHERWTGLAKVGAVMGVSVTSWVLAVVVWLALRPR